MKLTVSRETFLARLGIAVRGASTRSSIQTLAGVLIRVADGRAELQSTDMELGLRVSLDLNESGDGQAVIPGRLLLDVVRSLPKDELSLEYRSAQQDVEVVSGSAKFHLRTLPPEDFPALPDVPSDGVLQVPAGAFVDTINRVARAASRDETRPHLTGVLVTADGTTLRMVATDSYRLSVKETTLDEALPSSLEANVPARTLQELGRIGAWAQIAGIEQPVLPVPAKVSLLDPVPRSTDIAAVSAVVRVMVSAPVPPVMVSVLDTVAELVKLPSVRVSLPTPRSIEPPLIAAPSVTASAPEPPTRV